MEIRLPILIDSANDNIEGKFITISVINDNLYISIGEESRLIAVDMEEARDAILLLTAKRGR